MTSLFGVMVTVLFALPLPCVCAWASPHSRYLGLRKARGWGQTTANLATVAAAERASRPRSAVRMLLQVRWRRGNHSLGSAPPPCRNSGDGGDGRAATVAAAARSQPPDAARRGFRRTP